MKPGTKIGPANWQPRLEKSQACYTEVYFMLSRFKEHQAMFSCLRKKSISFGLHFWAKLPDDFMPNLVFKGQIAEKSVKLIKQTINIAPRVGTSYVNIHPGSFHLRKIYFKDDQVKITVTNKAIGLKEGKDDVWVVPEPLKDHVANFKSLLSLLSESSSALFRACEKSSSA